MIRRIVRFEQIGRSLAFLIVPVWLGAGLMGQDHSGAKSSSSALHATHVLGFEGMAKNVNGDFSIQDDALRFQTSEGAGAQIGLASIKDVSLGQEDKEVGGTSMAVGRAAAPFGGGRVIGLFAHKKYDIVTLQYLDRDGGLHGAIFQLNKGQGQLLKNELEGRGVRVAEAEDETNGSKNEREKNDGK